MSAETGLLRLTKHHGAGNDFLVYRDPDGAWPLTPALASALCPRHTGVGADGLIRITSPGAAGGADLSMELRNADGSAAEMSGNGIRCAVQAAARAGMVTPPRIAVATGAGLKTVELVAGPSPSEASASVDMGLVRLGPETEAPPGASAARTADAGNPHLVVLVDDPASVDLRAMAAWAAGSFPEGVNVEVIAATSPRDLSLRVFERGAGATLACGTGSCAAAAAAHQWGLVGDRVEVANPGGTLGVMLQIQGGTREVMRATLSGPVAWVADVEVRPALVGAALRPRPAAEPVDPTRAAVTPGRS